jgi:hypothetical protein
MRDRWPRKEHEGQMANKRTWRTDDQEMNMKDRWPRKEHEGQIAKKRTWRTDGQEKNMKDRWPWKEQITRQKTKLRIEQHEPHYNWGWTPDLREGKLFLLHMWYPSCNVGFLRYVCSGCTEILLSIFDYKILCLVDNIWRAGYISLYILLCYMHAWIFWFGTPWSHW